MNDTDKQTLQEAVTTWGTNVQLVITLEEFAELSKEVAKTIRKKKPAEGLADEVADAEIMLAQLRIVLHELGEKNFDEQVEARRVFKMERLRQRLADWKAQHPHHQ